MNLQRYSIGTWVSGVGHTGLILWLIVGWGMNNTPMDFEVTQVSVVSGAEYEAMVAATSPNPVTEPIGEMVTPDMPVDTPAPVTEEVAPVTPAPTPAPEAPVEDTPPPPPPARPEPVAPPADTVVEPTPPEQPAGAPDMPVSDRPVERPADRVASTPTPPPPPDAEVSPQAQTAVVEDAPTETTDPVIEEQTPTAPEETATRIVSPDEKPSSAPTSTPRPPSRPSALVPPTPAPTQTPEPETQTAQAPAPAETPAAPAPDAEAANIAAALAAASGAAVNEGPATSGPPLTGGEEDGFRRAVSGCWVVDNGAQWASVTVTVGFSLTQEGKVAGDVELLNFTGGDQATARAAFEAARRAILRCQSSGYPLPADKYEHWKDVELTFDPSTMRLR